MVDHTSPEEKLLKLIRRGKTQEPHAQEAATTAGKSAAEMTVKFSTQKILKFDFRRLIFIGFLLSSALFVISFIYPFIGSKKIILPAIARVKMIVAKKEAQKEIKPYEFYLQGINNRPLFASSAQKEIDQPIASLDVDLLKDVSLLGVIFDQEPQAIVEDKKAQKTYYLHKGQAIAGFQIVDIQEGKIILDREGQKFELHL